MYVSIQSVWASDVLNGRTVGQGHSDQLISLPSSEVYSMCISKSPDQSYVPLHSWLAYPYNFDDLNGPLPESAWNCLPYCSYNPAPVIEGQYTPTTTAFYVNGEPIVTRFDGYCAPYVSRDWYKPWIAVPPQLFALDSAWANCGVGLGGWYDPPTALSPATTVAGPTFFAGSATPAPHITSSAVVSTNLPGSPTTSQNPATASDPELATSAASSTAPRVVSSNNQVSASTTNDPLPRSTPAPDSEDTSAGSSPSISAVESVTSAATAAQASPVPVSSSADPNLASAQSTNGSPSSLLSTVATPTSVEGVSISGSASQNIATILSLIQSLTGVAPGEVSSDPSKTIASTLSALGSLSYAATTQGEGGGSTRPYAASGESTPSDDPGTDITTVATASPDDPNPTAAITQAAGPSQGVQRSGNDISQQQNQPQSTQQVDPPRSSTNGAPAAIPVSSHNSSPTGAVTFEAAGQTFTAVPLSGASNVVQIGGSMLSQGGPAATLAGASLSVGPSGLLVDGSLTAGASGSSQALQATYTVAAGSSIYTIIAPSPISGSSAVVLTAGGSTLIWEADSSVSLGGPRTSFVSSGNIAVSTNGDPTAAPSQSAQSGQGGGNGSTQDGVDPTVITIGTSAYTIAASHLGGSNVVVVANGGSTITLVPGSFTTLGSEIISAASSGAVLGTGTAATSVTLLETHSISYRTITSEAAAQDGLDPTVVTIGTSAYTIAASQLRGSSVVVVANGGSTANLASGSSTELGGEIISAPSAGGAVIGTGTAATSITLSKTHPISGSTATSEAAASTPLQTGTATIASESTRKSSANARWMVPRIATLLWLTFTAGAVLLA